MTKEALIKGKNIQSRIESIEYECKNLKEMERRLNESNSSGAIEFGHLRVTVPDKIKETLIALILSTYAQELRSLQQEFDEL